MAVRFTLVLCASAFLVQLAYSAPFGSFGAPYGCGCNGFAGPGMFDGFGAPGFAFDGFAGPYDGFGAPGFAFDGFAGPYDGFGYGCGVASTGGGLPCASASPIPPVGVSILSENVYEGALAAGGNLPFLGTVAVEGVLPTAGAGAISYGCGNGAAGIAVEEGPIATGIAPYAPGFYGAPYGAYNGFGGLGYGYGTGFGTGCGCGGFY